MAKLRRKGKLKEYKELKQEMLAEVGQADALGVDVGKSGKHNNEIIKEILNIYFSILKASESADKKKSSPLLKSVFLGIPQFTQFINIEIVWDLINVLREFLQFELEGTSNHAISNVLAGLLCVFQIIEVGAGTSFNIDEKDFMDSLYAVIQKMIFQPFDFSISDFLAFLKCAHLVLVQKRQY